MMCEPLRSYSPLKTSPFGLWSRLDRRRSPRKAPIRETVRTTTRQTIPVGTELRHIIELRLIT
jgi:hypothetical protein